MFRAIVVLGLSVALVTGCDTFIRPTEPIQNRESVAVVKSGFWGGIYRGGKVVIETAGPASRMDRGQRQLIVPPGTHRAEIQLLLCIDMRAACRGLTHAEIDFQVEAGREYKAKAKEKIHGQRDFWVWIEDAATGKVVGGSLPQL